ncbi:hypothetical protein PCI56_24590 [Plesiomonas shigelloides subsp. oncorhynchi]|nr:hypothetical protein [Plesiomonas shigelloides]
MVGQHAGGDGICQLQQRRSFAGRIRISGGNFTLNVISNAIAIEIDSN